MTNQIVFLVQVPFMLCPMWQETGIPADALIEVAANQMGLYQRWGKC